MCNKYVFGSVTLIYVHCFPSIHAFIYDGFCFFGHKNGLAWPWQWYNLVPCFLWFYVFIYSEVTRQHSRWRISLSGIWSVSTMSSAAAPESIASYGPKVVFVQRKLSLPKYCTKTRSDNPRWKSNSLFWFPLPFLKEDNSNNSLVKVEHGWYTHEINSLSTPWEGGIDLPTSLMHHPPRLVILYPWVKMLYQFRIMCKQQVELLVILQSDWWWTFWGYCSSRIL